MFKVSVSMEKDLLYEIDCSAFFSVVARKL